MWMVIFMMVVRCCEKLNSDVSGCKMNGVVWRLCEIVLVFLGFGCFDLVFFYFCGLVLVDVLDWCFSMGLG